MIRLTEISIAAVTAMAFSLATGAVFATAPKTGNDINKAMTVFQGIGNKDAALATKYIDAKHFVNHNPGSFLNDDFAKMGTFFDGDNFIRHDARGGDSLSALGALMQEQAKQDIVTKVGKIEKVLGQVTSFWSPPAAPLPTDQWLTTTCSELPTERLPSTGTPSRTFLRRKSGRTRTESSNQALPS